jgi:hypothetical protein
MGLACLGTVILRMKQTVSVHFFPYQEDDVPDTKHLFRHYAVSNCFPSNCRVELWSLEIFR